MRGQYGHDDAGKGSIQRPVGNRSDWERRWNRIFSSKTVTEQPKDLLGPSVLGSCAPVPGRDVGVVDS